VAVVEDASGRGTQVPAAQLAAGDEVTEVDTPDGPWYRVLRVDRVNGRVLVDDGSDVGVEVAVGEWGAVVLRRRPPAH